MTLIICDEDTCPVCGAYFERTGACANGHYPQEKGDNMPVMKKITCPCGISAVCTNTASVGVVARETGFKPVLGYQGDIRYLCPTCTAKANEAAQTLARIVGTWDIYMHSFDPDRA